MSCKRQQDTISLFPLNNYDQNIAHWIKPTDSDYNTPLLPQAQQQHRLTEFYDHYFSSTAASPWSYAYIQKILQQVAPDDLASAEKNLITLFNNRDKNGDDIGYGENFRPHSPHWIETILANINLSQFNAPLAYHTENRAITVNNLLVRALPTDDPVYYSYKLAGEGYPFDNLQISAIWIGTPVYIFGESNDHIWSFILGPGLIGWVKTNGIARVNDSFVTTWQTAAKNKLAAIIQTATPINTTSLQQHFPAYVGTVFPVFNQNPTTLRLMIPIKDATGQASIDYADVSIQNATVMPWLATPYHFAQLIKTLQGRPYGWGNINFYNDCSAELKSLYTPFGIWLPRHSSDQIKQGVLVDKSAASMPERLNYLQKKGHKLMTILYIGGHIILYIGNYPNPHAADHAPMVMTYQNMWGLRPTNNKRRAIVGQSVLFPLLPHYPEDHSLVSLADKKYFQIAYLDEIPITVPNMLKIQLNILLHPELTPDNPLP
jgi:hypothetical protein